MKNLTRQCNFCGASAYARPQPPYDNGSEIVIEAKYTCTRCARLVHKEVIERKPKPKQ